MLFNGPLVAYSLDDHRQTEQDWPIHDASSHISNTGRMVEEMEIKMRNLLQEVSVLRRVFLTIVLMITVIFKVYFGKTRDVVYDMRSIDDLEKARRQKELQKELVGFIKR